MQDTAQHEEHVSPITLEASSGRLMGLDGLRAIAVALVLAVHAKTCEGFPTGELWSRFAGSGGGGVTIFFVLSGFLVTWLLLNEESRSGRVSLRRFYLRRTIRILPAALTFLALVGAVGKSIGLVVDPKSWLASAFFVRNFVGTGNGSADGHFWSLSIEEQFYLLWPFTFLFLPKRWRLPFAMGILALCPIWRQFNMWHHGGENINWMRTDLRMDTLMTGCFLAVACRDGRCSRWIGLLARSPNTTFLLGLILFVTLNWGLVPLPRPLKPFDISLQLQGILLMVLGAVTIRMGPVHWILNCAPMAWLGRLSYSIYLWQEIFCIGSHRLPFQVFPLNLLWTVLAGMASFYLIERPCLNHREAWIRHIDRLMRRDRAG